MQVDRDMQVRQSAKLAIEQLNLCYFCLFDDCPGSTTYDSNFNGQRDPAVRTPAPPTFRRNGESRDARLTGLPLTRGCVRRLPPYFICPAAFRGKNIERIKE